MTEYVSQALREAAKDRLCCYMHQEPIHTFEEIVKNTDRVFLLRQRAKSFCEA